MLSVEAEKKEKPLNRALLRKEILLLNPSRGLASIIKADLSFKFHFNELTGTAFKNR